MKNNFNLFVLVVRGSVESKVYIRLMYKRRRYNFENGLRTILERFDNK